MFKYKLFLTYQVFVLIVKKDINGICDTRTIERVIMATFLVCAKVIARVKLPMTLSKLLLDLESWGWYHWKAL